MCMRVCVCVVAVVVCFCGPVIISVSCQEYVLPVDQAGVKTQNIIKLRQKLNGATFHKINNKNKVFFFFFSVGG